VDNEDTLPPSGRRNSKQHAVPLTRIQGKYGVEVELQVQTSYIGRCIHLFVPYDNQKGLALDSARASHCVGPAYDAST
jgi:hypothetical protein